MTNPVIRAAFKGISIWKT